MWRMLQVDEPDDYVVATGEAYSVREFAQRTFALLGLDHEEHIEIDPRYFRPAEVDYLLGDPSKAKAKLDWQPKTSFEELVKMMVESDLELAKRERTLRDAGHQVALPGVASA
jgi:GDPmannose 4,6-dehydratase